MDARKPKGGGPMFSSPVLEVAIGLALVYFILALLCTTLNEWVTGAQGLRGKTLVRGVKQLLGDELSSKVLQHPLVKSMSGTKGKPPSYLEPRQFALAIMDVVESHGEKKDGKVPSLHHAIKSLPEGGTKQVLEALLKEVEPQRSAIQQSIAQWFEDAMDRVSGWYKRQMLVRTALAAGLLVIAANADTFEMAHRLWTDSALRSTLIEQAQTRVETGLADYPDPESPIPTESGEETTAPDEAGSGPTDQELAAVSQLFGWTAELDRLQDPAVTFGPWLGSLILHHGLGWFLSALAVSLGAPFWFDLLKRMMNIRAAGKVPTEKKAKA
jgi:hypothetical protein